MTLSRSRLVHLNTVQRWRAAVLLLVVSQSLHWAALASADSNAESILKPMVILVGDSITERGFEDGGWGLLLSEDYKRKADVLNRGFGGYNSRMGTYVLDEFLNSFGSAGRIKLVTLGFGSNDAQAPTSAAGFLHVPLEEYKANLIAMVKKLRSKGVYNILIITPPPTNRDVPQRLWAAQRDTKPYAAAAVAVTNSLKVPYADLYAAFTGVKGWQDTAVKGDGIHLTPSGNKIVYDALISVINKQLKSVSPSALPWHMPDFRRVNSQQPGTTFNGLYGYKVQTGVQLPPQTQTSAAAAAAEAGKPLATAAKAKPAAAAAVVGPRQTPVCKGKAPLGASRDKAGQQWGYENGASCVYAAAAARAPSAAAPVTAAAVPGVKAVPAAAAAAAAPQATGVTSTVKPRAVAAAAPAPASTASKPVSSSGAANSKVAAAAAAPGKEPAACKGQMPATAVKDKSGHVWGYERGVSCVYQTAAKQRTGH